MYPVNKGLFLSILLLAITSILLFAMSITSLAANGITGLKQTGTSETEIAVSFNEMSDAYGYYVYYAGSDGVWKRNGKEGTLDTRSGSATISGLKAATTYKVKVVPVYYENGMFYPSNSQSATIKAITAPKAVTSLKQTKATAKTVTISWKKSKGASKYYVCNSSGKILAKTKKTSVTIKNLKAGSRKAYYVCAVKELNKKGAASELEGIYAYTTPGKVSKVGSWANGNLTWKPTVSNTVTLGWTRNKSDKYYASGYKVEIYSVDGKKKLKVYDVKSGYTLYKKFNIASVKNKGFRCRVTGYIKLNGKKYYGAKSSWKVVIPQPGFKMTRTGYHTVRINWDKIANATGYTIYACKDMYAEKPSWYKVAQVGAGTTSYEITNLTRGKYVGFYVIPTVKVGGKSYKAEAAWSIYGYLN